VARTLVIKLPSAQDVDSYSGERCERWDQLYFSLYRFSFSSKPGMQVLAPLQAVHNEEHWDDGMNLYRWGVVSSTSSVGLGPGMGVLWRWLCRGWWYWSWQL